MGRRGTNKRGLGGGNPKPPPGAFPIKKGRWPDGKKKNNDSPVLKALDLQLSPCQLSRVLMKNNVKWVKKIRI